MKKAVSVLIVCLLAFALTACVKSPVAKQSVTTVAMGDEARAVRDYLADLYGLSERTDEEIAAEFEQVILPYLYSRSEQEFPETEVSHALRKEEMTSLGDVYSLTKEGTDAVILYIHGGAWIWEIDPLHVAFCDKLVDTLNADVYMPNYPLAPQATYGDGYAMIEAVYDELLKLNKPIFVMGDSAGATMALGLTLTLKEKGKTLPEKVVVMAPCADATFSDPDMDEIALRDVMLPKSQCLACAKLWAGDADLTLPVLSPLFGNYTDFPDTLMFIGTDDILSSDDRKLFDRMCEAQVDVSLVVGEGFWHVYPLYNIPEQAQCLDLIADFCR